MRTALTLDMRAMTPIIDLPPTAYPQDGDVTDIPFGPVKLLDGGRMYPDPGPGIITRGF